MAPPRCRRLLPLLLYALVLATAAASVAGCSASREASRPNPAPPAEAKASPQQQGEQQREGAPADDSAAAGMADAQAPSDWQHLSLEEGGYAGVATERAYAWLGERAPKDTVVVAVLDAGIDTTHEDLDDVLWTNADEVPGNDRDDDQNGYVDDVHGWNFIGGADGENVEHDTYELTRLYAALRAQYEGADLDTLSGAARAEHERYQKLKSTFQQKKERLTQQYSQIQQVSLFVERARPVAAAALGGGDAPLTLERLQSVGPGAGQRARQVAQAFASLLEQSGAANVEALAEEVGKAEEQLRTRVEYGLNPDFDPRPIVGDDYADATERIYGNPDVEGPDAGHGTAVASLVAAERGNDLGLRGIAGAVKIMPVRTVPGGDERDKDVANAIRYAARNGARVINMSFGKGYSPRKDVVDAAVQYADSLGVLMVHAAGNDGANLDTTDSFPSKYYGGSNGAPAGVAENWIEVGASAAEGDSLLAASFSNYGAERVDLFAPGARVYVARPENSYGRSDGTSLAAPVVTGVAALVMSYYPELSAAQVKEALLASATDYSGTMVRRPGSGGEGPAQKVRFGDLSRTGGVVNAYEALRAAERMAAGE